MTRSSLALAGLLAVPALAPAQFLPFGRQTYNFGYAPAGFGRGVGFNYGGLSYNYFQNRQFLYAVNNPFLGYSGVYNFQFNYAGARPPFGYGVANPGAAYAAQAAYLYGGAGGYGYNVPGANPVVQEQQRLLAGGRAGNGRLDANRLIADQAAVEFGRAVPRPGAGGPPVPGDPALLDPPEAAVASGEALNALLAAIRPLADRRKGEPPVFPAEVLGHIRFDGPAVADAVGWVRDGRVAVPPAVAGPAFDRLRADVEKTAADLLAAAAGGRKADPGAADRLAHAVKTARGEGGDPLRALGVSDAQAANRFLSALAALADAGRDGGLGNLYPAKWATGATAAELVQHMDRQKLVFGPAAPGDEEAYAALQRGLAGYYLSLNPGGGR